MFTLNARYWFIAVVGLLANVSLAKANSFTEALESAYQHNPRIAIERSRLEQTDEGVSQALSNLRPNISATYGVGEQTTTVNNGASVDGNYDNRTLSLSEPLFRGGGTWASYHAAKQRVKAGQYQLSVVEQQVLLDAVNAYMDVVATSSILDLSRNNQSVLDKYLAASQDRFAVGEVTRTDVSQSEARLANAQAQVISSEGQVISAIATFERIVGHKPNSILTFPSLPELPLKLSEALERARAMNPQLLSAIHNAKSASYEVDTNIATLLPQVALVGSISRQEGLGQFGQTQFDQDRIGINVTIPLYQSGAEYSRVREAKSAAREQKHREMDTQQLVDEGVTQSWERLETAIANIKVREAQIEAGKIALDGVRAEQQAGSRTVLDILDAEQELFVARTQLVRAQRDRVVAAYALAQNLGQLTPQLLGLKSEIYDPEKHYDDVKWQFIGF